MITETTTASQLNETVTLMQPSVTTDQIKRNHIQSQKINPVSVDSGVTDFTLKFARLKKALRRRSSTIF